VGHALRSSNLLHVEANLARVSQSGLKTAEARRQVLHVTPSRRLHRRQVKDEQVDAMGCVGPCYPTFIVLNVLAPRGIIVI
jgi:hypothetical protein